MREVASTGVIAVRGEVLWGGMSLQTAEGHVRTLAAFDEDDLLRHEPPHNLLTLTPGPPRRAATSGHEKGEPLHDRRGLFSGERISGRIYTRTARRESTASASSVSSVSSTSLIGRRQRKQPISPLSLKSPDPTSAPQPDVMSPPAIIAQRQ